MSWANWGPIEKFQALIILPGAFMMVILNFLFGIYDQLGYVAYLQKTGSLRNYNSQEEIEALELIKGKFKNTILEPAENKFANIYNKFFNKKDEE